MNFWEHYKQGIGIALGAVTVYAVLAILLAIFMGRNALASGAPGGNPDRQGGAACSTSWA